MTNVDNSITIDVTMLSLCRDQGLGIKEENGKVKTEIFALLSVLCSVFFPLCFIIIQRYFL